jgi:hypothetical protein
VYGGGLLNPVPYFIREQCEASPIRPGRRADQFRKLYSGDDVVLATFDEVMTALLGNSGVVHEGLSESQARELGVERYMNSPAKKVRIVRDWVWLDIQVPQSEATVLEEDGFMPAVLYASWVVHDFSDSFKAGDWLCSSVLVAGSSVERPIEIRSSIYISVGRDFRRTVRREVIRSIAYGR